MENEFVLIIDFGSQVTQLIARRLRELKVYCEIHPFNKVNDEFLKKFTVMHIAIIPARSGSKRLPKKNIKLFYKKLKMF